MPMRIPMSKPGAGGGPGAPGRAARRGLSGRGLILCVVALVLVLMLAAPVQRYIAHRHAVAQAQQQERDLRAEVDDLTGQSKQWQDPAYVEQQARIRLQYVMPGDTVYQVVPDGGESAAPGAPGSDQPAGAPTTAPGQSWNERLWRSVEAADQAG